MGINHLDEKALTEWCEYMERDEDDWECFHCHFTCIYWEDLFMQDFESIDFNGGVQIFGDDIYQAVEAFCEMIVNDKYAQGYEMYRGMNGDYPGKFAEKFKRYFEYINEDVVEVPLLGKITAGSPIEAIETPDEYFSLPAYLVPNNEEVFTLKVSGESMINAGILDGDIVIVQRQKTARNGEIVVAMTEENEVTLKTFYKESTHIRLQPENDTMKPIILSNCYILGKAIGLYRKL